jgi:hypothetical protein
MAALTPSAALVTRLTRDHGLSVALARKLAAEFRLVQHDASAHLLRAGSRDRSLYLLESGLLRVYYETARGKDFNKAFVREGMFFVALSAYLTNEAVQFSVQALEPTRAYCMPFPRFPPAVPGAARRRGRTGVPERPRGALARCARGRGGADVPRRAARPVARARRRCARWADTCVAFANTGVARRHGGRTDAARSPRRNVRV